MKIWSKISLWGISSDVNPYLKRQIILCNQFNLFLFIIAFIRILFDIFLLHTPLFIALIFICLLSFIILNLNKLGYTTTGRVLSSIGYLLILFIPVVMGKMSQVKDYFTFGYIVMPGLALPMLFINYQREKKLLYIILLLKFILLSSYDQIFLLIYKDQTLHAFIHQNMIVYKVMQLSIWLILMIAFMLLNQINKIYENKLEIKNQLLKEKNLKIASQNEEIRGKNEELITKQNEIEVQSHKLSIAHKKTQNINLKLEKIISERTLKLAQTNQELDTFLYRSSHDFRRPMTTLMGLVEVAKITLSDQQALDLFKHVLDVSIDVDRMLEKLRMISEINSQEWLLEVIDFEEIVSQMTHKFKKPLEERGIDFKYNIKIENKFISYSILINHIITNLLENSFIFQRDENAEVSLYILSKNCQVIIEVTDNGLGIEEEYKDKIFDMYFRGSEKHRGNGLGLYVVKKALEKISGKVVIDSKPGIQTTFQVIIPSAKKNQD